MFIDVSRCVDYNDFSFKMNEIEKILVNKTQGTNTLEKILEFLETNQGIFIQETGAAIRLDSLGKKLRHISGNERVIEKLRSYVNLLIPSAPKDIKDFLQYIRNTILDSEHRLQTIVDWVDLMRIPLNQLDLTEEEFVGVVTKLEYPDLNNFNFRSIDLNKLTKLLLTPNLKFETTDTFFLSTLAKVCAQQNAAGIANVIQNFGIRNETVKFEIAKLCAERDGGYTAAYIKNFDIKNESARIKIARLCALQNSDWTAGLIQKFSIGHEPARIAIAKICAQMGGRYTAMYIQEFAIKDLASKIEIAKLCAQQDGGGTAEYIKKFAIKDETARIEIVKLCVQQNLLDTVEFFRNFDIKDELIKVEIAKLCAKQDITWILRHIQNFDFKNDWAKLEIAKLCANENGRYTTVYIQHFDIRDEEARIEIAKCCARQHGWGTSLRINNFAIKDETARIVIAKLCAQENGGGSANNIHNFGIKDEGARIEIGKLCAQQDGSQTVEYINNFKLHSEHSFYELYLDCIEADPQSLFHIGKFFGPRGLMSIPLMIDVLKVEAPEEAHRRELFEGIRLFIDTLPISKEHQKIILDMNSKIQALSPSVQNAAALWLVGSLLLMREMKPDALGWLLESGIWSELGLLKDPDLRASLYSSLRVFSAEGARTKLLWEVFTSNVRGIEGQRGLMLFAIPLINLKLEGIEECELFAVAHHLSTLQRKKKSRLRNVHQVKNLLHTIHSLAFSKELTAEQKKRGFEKIFFDPSNTANAMINDEQQILKNVIAAKGLLQLKDTEWPNAKENLHSLFQYSLEKLIPLEQFKGDVSAHYEEIFSQCRNPGGLLTYAAGLKTLGEPALLSSLGQYVVWVMNKTFKNNRYDTIRNPHLAKVLEGNSELLSLWKEEIRLDVNTLICGNKKEETFDSEQWLHTKLIVDKHLGNAKLPYLIKYFEEPSNKDRKEIFSALIKEITELLSTFSTSRTDPILVNLNLQKACLRLVIEGANDKKTFIKHLEEIDQILHHTTEPNTGFEASEFAADVKGLLEAFRKEAENATETKAPLQAVFTDDPIDLLLCGTDVSGSCQRLDGDPKLNKGLLGYLVDGKNRLLAIKDGDKIVARSLLRVLWDGKRPVLYRDRFYPDRISVPHKQALNILAKQVSRKMALPLTCGEGFLPYDKMLQSLGGPAPYEYCDGAGGVQKEGRYTIQAKILD